MLSALTSAACLKLAEVWLEIGVDDTSYGIDDVNDNPTQVPHYSDSDDTSKEEEDEGSRRRMESSHAGLAIDNAQTTTFRRCIAFRFDHEIYSLPVVTFMDISLFINAPNGTD